MLLIFGYRRVLQQPQPQAVVLHNYLCILIAYLMGAALADIYADPFELRDLLLKPRD